VVVLCKNQFYYFPALWPDSGHVAVDENDIRDILKAIETHASQSSQEESSKSAIGVFTSLSRSEWAQARFDLIKSSPKNATALHIIDSALFILVLDDFTPPTLHAAAANMLHGTNRLAEDSPVQVGTCINRWYDKLQLIVCKDGTTGINFEHSSIDGHTALRFVSDMFAETVITFAESIVELVHGRGRIQHIVEATIQRAAVDKGRRLDVLPKKIRFDIPDTVMDQIYYAETSLCDNVVSSDTFVLEFAGYGKNLIVKNNMSPDSFVQMSIMLAYYRLYGKLVCTYEPVLTKVRRAGTRAAVVSHPRM
jgi:carnitine O-acetyltransferase